MASTENPRLKQGSHPKLRPHERVLEYLWTEFERPDLKEGSRLPTVRELSTCLKVSVFTVQRVFHQLTAEGRIRTQVGNGTFLISPKKAGPMRIILSIPAPKKDSQIESWSYRIYGGMLRAAVQSKAPVILLPLSQGEADMESPSKKLQAQIFSCDGLVLFPSTKSEFNFQLQSWCEKEGKSVVCLNPPSKNATANFVSPDYFDANHRLGATWRQTGRKRILMISTRLSISISSQLRREGLIAGLSGNQVENDFAFRLVEVDDILERSGFEAIARLLDEKWIPDAVFCTGDFLALGALQSLLKAGLRIPEDVSVVGGSGLDLSNAAFPQMTRTHQLLETMGEALITMVCRCIQMSKGAASGAPGIYLPLSYMGGATTRPQENALLALPNAPPFPNIL